MSKADLDKIHEKMLEELKDSGGRIDAIFCCTDIKTKPDNCRKPGIAMAEYACQQFPEIKLSHSIMIGDTTSDIVFGKMAGMKTVQIGIEIIDSEPDMQFKSLYQFAKYCTNQ
jgi:HAD superfamily hydrolase (TIGR01662 family)